MIYFLRHGSTDWNENLNNELVWGGTKRWKLFEFRIRNW